MKNFIEYINEMTRHSGEPLNSKNQDCNTEWKRIFLEEKRFIKKINNIRPNMILYRYGNTYILTDEYSDYIAHIDFYSKNVEFKGNKKALIITDGNSNVRGRYIILLLAILDNVDIDFIFSDIILSDGAVKFYKKILQGGPYTPYILQHNKVYKPDVSTDYFNNSYRIGLAKLKNHITEITYELDTIRKNKFGISEYNEIALLYSINEEL